MRPVESMKREDLDEQPEAMIGLKRHTVKVVAHHPGWSALGAEACRQIQQACGDLIIDVQHVGSTAVPHLPAKPILDLAVAVATKDTIPLLIQKLTGTGYLYRGDEGDTGGHLFIRESEPNVRTIHLHIVTLSDPQWNNYLRFRDILRRDLDVRRRYAELKQRLSETFPENREAYTASKHDFISGVLNMDGQEPEDGNLLDLPGCR